MKGCSAWKYTKCGELKIYFIFFWVWDIWFAWVGRTNLAYLILSRIFVVVPRDLYMPDGRVARTVLCSSSDRVGPNCLRVGPGKILKILPVPTSAEAESTFGGSLQSDSRFCVGVWDRIVDSIALKILSHLIYFIKDFINCIRTVRFPKMLLQ
jgi:hypothetical protein